MMHKPNNDPAQPYRAFISHSHRDRAFAKRLHRSLENFKFKDQNTGLQERLSPVFLDREELPAGGDLSERLQLALQNSKFLIVICSESATGSRWVNKEISIFHELGRNHRVIPVISPNFRGNDISASYPIALKTVRSLDTENGQVFQSPEYVAADFRKDMDGYKDGLLKVASGLLEVNLDYLKRRELQKTRRRLAYANTAVFVFAGLAISAAWAGWTAHHRGKSIERTFHAVLSTMQSDLQAVLSQYSQGTISHGEAERRLAAAERQLQIAVDADYQNEWLAKNEDRLRESITALRAALGMRDEMEAFMDVLQSIPTEELLKLDPGLEQARIDFLDAASGLEETADTTGGYQEPEIGEEIPF